MIAHSSDLGFVRESICGAIDPPSMEQARFRLELVALRGAPRGILYVYGPASEAGFSQLFGTIDELREIARLRYPDAELHETLLDALLEFRDPGSPRLRGGAATGCKATV